MSTITETKPSYTRGNYKTKYRIQVTLPNGDVHKFDSYTQMGKFFNVTPQTISIKLNKGTPIKSGSMKGITYEFIN